MPHEGRYCNESSVRGHFGLQTVGRTRPTALVRDPNAGHSQIELGLRDKSCEHLGKQIRSPNDAPGNPAEDTAKVLSFGREDRGVLREITIPRKPMAPEEVVHRRAIPWAKLVVFGFLYRFDINFGGDRLLGIVDRRASFESDTDHKDVGRVVAHQRIGAR